jgi:hypothetical protein
MKNRPIHENLDTSFVNLSALVKYLRRRQFAGQIRIELSGYEADIYLSSENQLKVREYDHIAGRIAEGEEALQRILIRSREPGGIINVYQQVADTPVEFQHPIEVLRPASVAPKPSPIPKPIGESNHIAVQPVVQQIPVKVATVPNGNGNGKPKIEFPESGEVRSVKIELPKPSVKPAPAKSALPNLPFEFSNNVESRARKNDISADEFQHLLELMGELLGTVDRCLAMAKLDFGSAFLKACNEIAVDYPFLKALEYKKGKIVTVQVKTNPKLLITGIIEALRRILDKLGSNPKFGEVYRYTSQKILGLVHHRRSLYDKFAITKPLEKIVGA